jgi:hypothetical protein
MQAEALRVFPSAYVIRQRLYPVNTYEAGTFLIKGDSSSATHGWEDLNGIDVLLVPTPAELTLPDSPITLPDSAFDALVVGLANWMAQRMGVLNSMPTLRQESGDSESAAIASLAGQDTTSTWTVRRVC